MIYDPKANFQKFHEKDANELRRMVQQPSFQLGLTFALAEMGTRDVTKEQMEGANVFVEILASIGDKEELPAKFPEKRLEVLDRPSGDKEEAKPKKKKAR